MQRVTRYEAVGRRLAHDVTQVVPGMSKRVYLRRGDVVGREHLETLGDMGKEHLVVLDGDEAPSGEVHENDAARLLAHAAAGDGTRAGDPVEGKCDVAAAVDGLFTADVARVDATNERFAGQAALITRPSGVPVRAGDRVGIARVYPAYLPGEAAERLAEVGTALQVAAFRAHRAAVVVTGAEVAAGRVTDAFGPLLGEKLAAFGSTVASVKVVADDADAIAATIRSAAQAADLVFVTGGMAVDADDVTQSAIRRAGVDVRFAGVPMQPATLLLFGTLGTVALFGVPAGVLYDKTSALDRLLPFVLAGHLPTAAEVLRMGVGGMLAAAGHGHAAPAGSGVPGGRAR